MQLLESAAFAAWPSALSTDLHGWQLRLDSGYTKRANSLNATAHSGPLSDAEMDSIEARFRERGLTPTVRLTSFSSAPEADAMLARRGYRHCDPSLVMTRSLSAAEGEAPEAETLEGAEPWLAAFQRIAGQSSADQAAHLEILRRIVHPAAWAAHAVAGSPRSCGLGVLVDQHLGLFDIATHANHQRQGHAQQLCRGLLAWGRRRGARTAFLQVVAANDAAIRLYEKIGFEIAYRYWYRVL
jgi:N-acetylglutamate synthase